MKILEWLANNPTTVEVEIEEVYDQGNLIGLKFIPYVLLTCSQ